MSLPGYSQITTFVREWRGKEDCAVHAFMPLKFELGEAFQFDWSEEDFVVGGIFLTAQGDGATIIDKFLRMGGEYS